MWRGRLKERDPEDGDIPTAGSDDKGLTLFHEGDSRKHKVTFVNQNDSFSK